MIITSKDNEIIKHIKLLEKKKVRDEYNEYILEGIKVLKEAIDENVEIIKLVVSEEKQADGEFAKLISKIEKEKIVYVTQNLFKYISETITPQGILGIAKKKNCELNKYDDTIFILDNIQDPGNLGTIIRSLDSCGLKQLILSENTVDCYNSKVVRSSMGAIFRIDIFENQNLKTRIEELKLLGYKIIVTSLDTDKTHFDIDYKKSAIIIGNESKGVSKDVLELADKKIKIPMLGKTESLNASVAASVIMYEIVRQRLS